MKRKTKPTTKSTKAKAKPSKANARSSKPVRKPESVMLVYGFDESGRPCAAVFGEAYFKLARKAAGLMKLSVFVEKATEVSTALKGIKTGCVYASGSGFVPNVRPKRFEELVATLKLQPPAPAPTVPEVKRPTSWDGIEVGHLVTAQSDSPSDGWWPAVVEAIDGDMLSLRSAEFPDITGIRHRYAVALGYTPDYVPPDGLAEAAPGLPKDWDGLEAGHLVIARESHQEGCFEALVTNVEAGQVTLRWRGFPKLPAFTRPLRDIALLYPKAPDHKGSDSDDTPS